MTRLRCRMRQRSGCAGIAIGGPGAIVWMWMTAILGIATKFFTCSLAVMYRGKDSNGDLQGGPMYVIREALPKGWHSLGYAFALLGLLGCLPIFQTKHLSRIASLVIVSDLNDFALTKVVSSAVGTKLSHLVRKV